MKQIVAFVFRLINFAALIGIFYYLFKKYLLGTIKKQIAEKKQQIKQLIGKRQDLEHNQQEMDQSLVQQAQLCTSLKEQVSQWRARVELELANRIQEKKEREEKLKQRAHKKSDWLQQNRIEEKVFPVALEQARNELRKKFSTAQQGRAYVDKILARMQKGKS